MSDFFNLSRSVSESQSLDAFEYNLDYFSGAQAAVYIGNILIDEVTSLQWTVQQSKIPIYGYASQTFDEMANGTIIVQGSFSINFTHAGYLWSVLKNQEKFNVGNPNYNTNAAKRSIERAILEKASQGNSSVNSQDGLETRIESYRKFLKDNKEGFTSTNITKNMNDLIWGPDNTSKNSAFRTTDDYSDELRTDRRELNGFDIYLQFKHDGMVSSETRKIQDVHLIGKSQAIVIDENPVQEVYSFYAKNVI